MKKVKSYEELVALAHPVRWKILQLLSKKEMYLYDIAKKLNMSPPAVHYHINILKPFLTVKKIKTKNKLEKHIYSIKDDALLIQFSPSYINLYKHSPYKKFLSNKVTIVVGSPDPHGKYKVRARDAYLAAELANYLGKTGIDAKVVWDTEVKSLKLYNQNLIIIGGPLSNVITYDLNSQLPAKFDKESGFRAITYNDQLISEETIGLIYGGKNPYSPKHSILLLAGTTLQGTKSAILAITNEKIDLPGGYIVEGIDKDSNGIIDDIEIIATI